MKYALGCFYFISFVLALLIIFSHQHSRQTFPLDKVKVDDYSGEAETIYINDDLTINSDATFEDCNFSGATLYSNSRTGLDTGSDSAPNIVPFIPSWLG